MERVYSPTMLKNSDIVKAPERMLEHNDCAVVATANVLDIPYSEAHALLRKHGRRNRKGTKWSITKKALESRASIREHLISVPMSNMGYFRATRRQYPTVAQYLHKLPKIGNFLLASTTHAFAYVDGELRDNIEGGKMRARMAKCLEVIKPEPVKADLTQSEISEMWERLNKIVL
jgi:hypothetical protein